MTRPFLLFFWLFFLYSTIYFQAGITNSQMSDHEVSFGNIYSEDNRLYIDWNYTCTSGSCNYTYFELTISSCNSSNISLVYNISINCDATEVPLYSGDEDIIVEIHVCDSDDQCYLCSSKSALRINKDRLGIRNIGGPPVSDGYHFNFSFFDMCDLSSCLAPQSIIINGITRVINITTQDIEGTNALQYINLTLRLINTTEASTQFGDVFTLQEEISMSKDECQRNIIDCTTLENRGIFYRVILNDSNPQETKQLPSECITAGDLTTPSSSILTSSTLSSSTHHTSSTSSTVSSLSMSTPLTTETPPSPSPSPSPGNDDNDGGRLSSGEIAGIVIGCVIVGVIALVILL